jgi:PTH1 family peptidyl-tRNA hydrolase
VKLIVGLGNPGPRYETTRHNAGFMVIDELARRWKTQVDQEQKRFEGLLAETQVLDERVLLLKPTTLMNLSGRSVLATANFYKISPPDLLVIFDDMDLPLGALRLRAAGSAGGQKGMADVIRALGSDEIARVRVGIGRGRRTGAVDHVLSRFAEKELEEIQFAIIEAAKAAEVWVRKGLTTAMNRFNRIRED